MSTVETGWLGHLKGQAAEDCVARHYARRGAAMLARRWRGTAGEIDLVFRACDGSIIFAEVKSSKRAAWAVRAVRPQQTARLLATASEFLGTQPGGQRTDTRFDLATVDGTGQVSVLENAIAA